MKLWVKIVIIVTVWVTIAIVVSARMYYQQEGGDQPFTDILVSGLPSWLLWAAGTPIIFRLAGALPLSKKKWLSSIIIQIVCCALFLFAYLFAITFLDGIVSGNPVDQERFIEVVRQNLANHWHFILIIYWVVLAIAYVSHYIGSTRPVSSEQEYENSILVKTTYGFVLVEIEDFQYVKDGGKKIMFHTGRSTHLNRQRAVIEKGTLVEQEHYRPERRIVIDLAKIKRAEQVGPDEFVYYIGFSHELRFHRKMYMQLGGWLPTPVIKHT